MGPTYRQSDRTPGSPNPIPPTTCITRTWARALFAATPSADGLVYRCRHNEDQFAWMLTTDPANPTHPALEVAGASVDLQSPAGLVLVERILAYYNATLASTV